MKKNKVFIFIGAFILLLLCFLPALIRHEGKEEYDVVIFGDSIVAGVFSRESVGVCLEKMTGMKTLTGAFGGTGMALGKDKYAGNTIELFSMYALSENVRKHDFSLTYMSSGADAEIDIAHYPYYSRLLSEVNWKKVKYIVIEHGANDYSAGTPVDNRDNPYDPDTYIGALRCVIKNLKKGAPNAEIILMTPIYSHLEDDRDCYEADYGGGFLEDYVNAELNFARSEGITIVDNFHDFTINRDNYDKYLIDGLHCNDEGSRLIAEHLCEILQK